MNTTSRRSGYTLIELMVVLSVSSTLLMVSVGWIHQSMTLASTMRDRQHHHQNLMRLSRQLRDDVHHGRSVSMASDQQLVITFADDQKLSYTITDNGIWRRSINGGGPVSQDSFEFSQPVAARWDASELPDWISLVVARKHRVSTPIDGPLTDGSMSTAIRGDSWPIDLQVRAAIGRWDSLGGAAP
jgi:prepilin-type N-terminal cleavage/methylation domain-containing protein